MVETVSISTNTMNLSTLSEISILIVDDEFVNRTLLERILEKDFAVTTASNGQEAFDLIKNQSFSLILLDINMPIMNGYMFLNQFRKLPEYTDTPVIIISARDSQEDIVEGLRNGANDYITKPYNLDIMRARIHTQLERKQIYDSYKSTIQQLKVAQDLQQNFYRIVTHDLKSPLSNLRMAHYLLRETIHDNPAADSLLENMEHILRDMQEMLRVFIEMSAKNDNKVAYDPETISAHELTLEVVERYKLSAAQKNMSFEILGSDGYLVADRQLSNQIIDNLVSNAIKYSPYNSMIQILIETLDEFIRIHVIDQGPGILATERNNLFQMYSQTSNQPSGNEASTGLGLWIVKQFSEVQGGNFGVEFPQAGGADFWVELPISKN